jgi:hypothetical protein
VAYVREKKVTVGGKVYSGYYQLVEGHRVEGKVRQRMIAHLGKFPTIEDARRYADEHFSRDPIDELRQLCQQAYDLQMSAYRIETPEEERAAAREKLKEMEAKMLPLLDSLSEEDQKAVRAEHLPMLVGQLNRRYNEYMTTTIEWAFTPVVEEYKKVGKTDELTAEAVRVWRSLTREQQGYTLNWSISKEIQEFVARAVRDHVNP